MTGRDGHGAHRATGQHGHAGQRRESSRTMSPWRRRKLTELELQEHDDSDEPLREDEDDDD